MLHLSVEACGLVFESLSFLVELLNQLFLLVDAGGVLFEEPRGNVHGDGAGEHNRRQDDSQEVSEIKLAYTGALVPREIRNVDDDGLNGRVVVDDLLRHARRSLPGQRFPLVLVVF